MTRIILSDINPDGARMEVFNFENLKSFDIFSFGSDKVKLVHLDENDTPKLQAEGTTSIAEWIDNINSSDGYSIKYKGDVPLPKMEFNDITERIMLNGSTINNKELSSWGIWANSGIRLWEIVLGNDLFKNGLSKVILHLNKVNGESYNRGDFRFGRINGNNDGKKGIEACLYDKKAVVYLDTDALGTIFETDEYRGKKHVTVSGEIEVMRGAGGGKIAFYYPCSFVLLNTSPEITGIAYQTPASIDFGTSSTCVAIEGANGQPELLSLSSDDDGYNEINIFENPTNIMVYNWGELYKQWVCDTSGSPLLYKGSKTDYNNYEKNLKDKPNAMQVDFDFGYNVKEILNLDDSGQEDLNSILSLIKMIPYKMICLKDQPEFIPYNDSDKVINIVLNPAEQDEKHLDPVAFYGYLIGKAINDNSKRQVVYTKFNVTSPVVFNESVKKSLCNSLEYGLKMSVPKPLRDKVKVKMDYTEPVAYIGAICGTEIKVASGKSEMVAVYDFGGGTLDFSYGIISNEDEDQPTITIKHVSGMENIGGESIIERISFRIYCNNANEMKNLDIPCVQPVGETLPDNIPEELVKNSNFARINMNQINAAISRKIFEDPNYDDSESASLNGALFNRDGDSIPIEINIPQNIKEEFLSDLIENTIEKFENEMNSAFGDVDGYKKEAVHVFLAGNSSRNIIVRETMNQKFKDKVHFVEESKDKRYAVTPKTAVAIGQMRLNNFNVIGDKVGFRYYVGFINMAENAFVPKLKCSSSEKGWIKFKKISNDSTDIYYSTTLPSPGEDIPKKPVDTTDMKGKYLFIKIKDENSIEYCVSASDSKPSDEETQAAATLALNL